MRKNISTIIALVVLTIGLSLIVFAQDNRSQQPFKNAQEAFQALDRQGVLQKPILLTDALATKQAKSDDLISLISHPQSSPIAKLIAKSTNGEVEILSKSRPTDFVPPFYVQCDKEILERNQTVNCGLLSLYGSEAPFIAYARLWVPDYTGHIADAVLTNLNIGIFGSVPNGAPYYGFVYESAFSKQFGQGDRSGDYLLETIVIDMQGGAVFQSFNPLFYRVTGSARRGPFAINDYLKFGSALAVTGHFPMNRDVFVVIGKITTSWELIQTSSPTGTSLLIPNPFCSFTGEQFADITVADNFTRYSVTKADAFIATCDQ